MGGLFKKISTILVSLIFIFFLGTIFYVNLDVSGYLHNGYYATYSPVDFKYIIYSFIFTILIILLFKFVKLSNKVFLILLISLNVIIFTIRIVLINSFNIGTSGDAMQLLISVSELIKGNSGAFLKGGYVTIYSQQLGFAAFLLPLMSLFEFDYSSYYYINAFLLQIANLLIAFSFYKKDNYRNIFWVNLGLSLFIPNLFYQFILYSDPIGWFFIALTIFMISKSELKSNKYIYIAVIIQSIAILIRSYSVVLSIAIILTLLFFKNIKSWVQYTAIILLFISTLVLPTMLLESSFNSINKTEVGMYSLPSKTWVAIGLSGAGYDPKYINYFSSIDNDEGLMNEYLDQELNGIINNLLQNNNLKNLLLSKLIFAWTNPDFDSLSYIMPQEWGAQLQDFYDDNSIRLGRASGDSGPTNVIGEMIYKYLFTIRNIEKIFFMSVIELTMISAIINMFKKRNWWYFFYPLMFIGFYILFMILETQPRYVYAAANILVIYVFFSLPETIDTLKLPLKKWYS